MMRIREFLFFSKCKWYHATTLTGAMAMLTKGINAGINAGKPRDFGPGLYLCPEYKWAEANAKTLIEDSAMDDAAKREIPVIMEFRFRPIKLLKAGYTAKYFSKANKEYAEFTVTNWKTPGKIDAPEDMIGGPMTRFGQGHIISYGTDEEIYAFFMRPQKGAYQLLLHSQKVCDIVKVRKIYFITERR